MGISLNDLDATKASSEAFEFEYVNHNGDATGIFFRVLGGQSEVVKAETNRLQNERRRRAAAREINQRIGTAKKPDFEPFETDVEYGRRVAAVRLVGWRMEGEDSGLSPEQKKRFNGFTDPCTPENVLRLCQNNDHIAAQITEQSDAMENFIGI